MLKLEDSSWRWRHFIWTASVFIVFPNVVMSLLALNYGLERPYIDVDYAAVMLLLIASQRVLGIIALFTVFFFDVLALVGQIFPVLRISDLFYMSKFIGMAPVEYKVSAILLFFLFLIMTFLFLYKNHKRGKLESLCCFNLLIVIYGVSAIFGDAEETQVWSDAERSFVSSQIIFGIDSRRTGFVESLSVDGSLLGDITLEGATKPWFVDLDTVDNKVLLIINESWGVSSQQIADAVMAPLLMSSDEIYDWQQGVLSFNGMTVEAEIRELCQSDLLHFNFENHDKDLTGCIPNQLRQRGYKTHSFHGAGGLMYDRAKWYPKVGFDSMTFFESHSWGRRCYSFPGACDVDMAKYVAHSYSSKEMVFGYWLTLNTHQSYDLRDLSEEVLQCEDIDVRPGTESCRNLKLQNQFFKSLSELVSLPDMSGVRVIVVSDHEPRISDQKQMDLYFEKGKVPWVSFKVR